MKAGGSAIRRRPYLPTPADRAPIHVDEVEVVAVDRREEDAVRRPERRHGRDDACRDRRLDDGRTVAARPVDVLAVGAHLEPRCVLVRGTIRSSSGLQPVMGQAMSPLE